MASLGQRITCLLLLGLLILSSPAAVAASVPGREIVVVYSESHPDSKGVADHYAAARGVPSSNLIALKVSNDSELSRTQYVAEIQLPLLKELERRNLASFSNYVAAPGPLAPGGPAWRCQSASVRYLVLCWGMPHRIVNDPALLGQLPTNFPAQLRRNDASVDAELMLLPAAGAYPLVGGVGNPFYISTNRAAFHPTNGIIMVGRIDGPTPAIARGLVDKALSCETNGFLGNAYFDLRNISAGGYRKGDEWLTNAATTCRRVGLSTYVDNRPDTLPATFPLSHVGVYMGWYSGEVDGPFKRPEVEFMPGAIAYHLHSYNGQYPRDAGIRWVGPLLAKGATVTFGSVDEPYLDFTPNAHAFIELMAGGGYNVGEAALACQSWLSWVNVFYGDPVFNPFTQNLTELESRLAAAKNTNVAWTVLRKANFLLQTGGNPSLVRDSLADYPLSTNNPVLAEKVASLYADASQLRKAIEWGRRALDLNPSPQQRLRLLLNLAEWQDSSIKREDAFDTLLKVEEFRPDYAELIPFRERQLQLARDAGRPAQVERLKAEIERLKAPKPKP